MKIRRVALYDARVTLIAVAGLTDAVLHLLAATPRDLRRAGRRAA
ncbi:MAG: hypothetical protein ABWK05_08675 [Pyrobaculum sp.]